MPFFPAGLKDSRALGLGSNSRSVSPLFMDSFSFEASFRRPVGHVGHVLGDQRASGRGGTQVPCAPSEGGAAGAEEVRASGAWKSRVETRVCPRLSFQPLRVDAEAPPGPGSPEPRSAASSRAGGRKDGRELGEQGRGQAPWDPGPRDSEDLRLRAPLKARVRLRLVPRCCQGGLSPSARDPGQTFAG